MFPWVVDCDVKVYIAKFIDAMRLYVPQCVRRTTQSWRVDLIAAYPAAFLKYVRP